MYVVHTKDQLTVVNRELIKVKSFQQLCATLLAECQHVGITQCSEIKQRQQQCIILG